MSQMKENLKVEIDVKQMSSSSASGYAVSSAAIPQPWEEGGIQLYCLGEGGIQLYCLGLSVPKSAILCIPIGCGSLY